MIDLISKLELCTSGDYQMNSSSCQCVAIFIAALYMNTAKTNVIDTGRKRTTVSGLFRLVYSYL